MRVSVVIPVYNALRFLDRAAGSVLGQTHADVELILVNDGSTDGSRELCEKYARADSRVKALSQPNSGPAAARNAGVRSAAGDFVYFLDADDYLEKNALEVLLAAYGRSQPDLVMSNFRKLENSGKIVGQSVTFRPDDAPCREPLKELSKPDIAAFVRHFLKHPSNHLISYCWARLYKLDTIRAKGLAANEEMRLFEDLVFNLDYLQHAEKTVFVNEGSYVYAMHNDHVSASMGILNSASLLHDMAIFKAKVAGFFRVPGFDVAGQADIAREIGHALVHYAIIFLVRSCRQITPGNRQLIRDEIARLVSAPILRESLKSYAPSKGNSRVLPLLMRLGAVGPLMRLCAWKAHKRYGRMRSARS